MTAWDDLISATLVGVERRPFPVTRLNDAVGGTPAIDVTGAEAQALAAAAVLTAYRRAGRRPQRAALRPLPAPPDPRPVCSAKAAQLLSLLTEGAVKASGGNDELIALWLEACVSAGRHPPAAMTVGLLDLATAKPSLRAAVSAAVGPRGAWLARANPAWVWDAEASAPEAASYETAPRAERAALLRSLRSRDPAAGRELLLSSWKSEPAADRAALLAALDVGLSDDDEPFLDQVLDDRAASVRAVAIELLERLPDSRRAARMAERALALVRVEGRFRRRLDVSLPGEPDELARRDGLLDASQPGRGRLANLLAQIVAATPLGAWETLGMEPQELVGLAGDEPALRSGWILAATRQRDTRWAKALLAHGHHHHSLVGVLPAAEAEAFVASRLRFPGTPIEAVTLVPPPWSAPFSQTALAWVMEQKAGFTVIESLAMRLHPSAVPLVERWFEHTKDESVRRLLRKLAHTLSIRKTIAEEFS